MALSLADSPLAGKGGWLPLLLALVTGVLAFTLLGPCSLATLSWPISRRARVREVAPSAPPVNSAADIVPVIDFPDFDLHVLRPLRRPHDLSVGY